MIRISAAIITKNEEKNIRECLDGVSWADEIIVVDDESKDKTAEICRAYPKVKFYSNKMQGFGPQKNYALSQATGEWVLSIDADERITPELKEEIIAKTTQENYDGYYFKRNNLIFGKWLSDLEASSLRLFKREKGKFSSKKVHEAVVLEGEIGVLKNPLLHEPASFSSLGNYIEVYVKQYSSYAAQDLYDMGRRVTYFNFIFYFLVKPTFIFFQRYFIKRDYRHGIRGLPLSFFTAYAYYVSSLKLLKLQRKKNVK